MQLYVVRHAIAEEAADGQDDASRRLTTDGERKLRKVVHGLRELRVRFDRVLTSPWARARQTADALKPLCDELPVESDLLTRSPTAELLAHIAEVTSAGKHGTAVVGHEPWLGELVSLLAFGDTRFGDSLTLKKAGVVWLDGSAVPGGMMIRALVPPKFLRAVG
jgi:phosphohistidine phosphatase